MNEKQLRDRLINKINLIGNDLEFLEKEAYLPNSLGTRGFIDILAKDGKGNLVVIELKRSNASSREAIHEILKYLEGIKENQKLGDDEIRLIVVSTHWNELIVPFSSLYKRCNCNIEGYLLELDTNEEPISTRKVDPLPLETERLFSDHHMIRMYTSENELEKGIDSHINSYKAKGILDYVLIIIESSDSNYERELKMLEDDLKKINQNDIQAVDQKRIDDIKKKIPNYKFIIYSALLLMNENTYYRMLQEDKDVLEEVEEIIDDYKGEDKINTLHDYAVDYLEPIPYAGSTRVGNPAKFQAFMNMESYKIIDIIKKGALTNCIVSKDIIIDELSGSKGTTRQKYFKDIDSANRASLNLIKTEVKTCLEDNIVWQRHILHIIEEIENIADTTEYKGRIYIYNPMHIIYTIFLIGSSGQYFPWVPYYHIEVKMENESRLYCGALKRNGKVANLENTLKTQYDESLNDLFFSLTWGGYNHNDVEVAESLGLKYATHLIVKYKDMLDFYEYIDYRFRECDECNPINFLCDYLVEENELVGKVLELFKNSEEKSGVTLI